MFFLYIAMIVAEKVLGVTDKLATGLQATAMTASSGKEQADATIKHLQGLRQDAEFDAVYNRALELQTNLGNYLSLHSNT